MRILFHKQNDARHTLEIICDDGRRERVECETRSYLVHDLLHFAVESEASFDFGFWGALAAGKTLADLNDRQKPYGGEAMLFVEGLVAALTSAVKGMPAQALLERLGLNRQLPPWLTPPFIDAVNERMRRLRGCWNATPFGDAMELHWPAR